MNERRFEVQGDYGYGWEMLTKEETAEDAETMLLCYDENEPLYPHRIAFDREKE